MLGIRPLFSIVVFKMELPTSPPVVFSALTSDLVAKIRQVAKSLR